MKCISCNFISNSANFDLKTYTVVNERIKQQWTIFEYRRVRKRSCPNCKELFIVGHPLLIRKEKMIRKAKDLEKDLAKDAKLLVKKKKSLIVPEIQDIFKIPIPMRAEKIIDSFVTAGLGKLIIYPASPTQDKRIKFIFFNFAESKIFKTLRGKTRDQIYLDKTDQIHSILTSFKGNPSKTQSDVILKIIEQQKTKLEFYDRVNQRRVKPSIYSDKYELILNALIYLFNLIEEENLITTKKLSKSLNIDLYDFNRIKYSLKGILGNKLLMFNILSMQQTMYIDPIPIPKELTDEIVKFEVELRKFIIYVLIGHYKDVNKSYKEGIPDLLKNYLGKLEKKEIENNLEKQLKNNVKLDKTSNSFDLFLHFHNMGIDTIEIFYQFFQQTTFNHLIILIQHHWSRVFSSIFNLHSCNKVINILKIIKDARNTEAHRKYKIAEISKIIESVYIIRSFITPIISIQLTMF